MQKLAKFIMIASLVICGFAMLSVGTTTITAKTNNNKKCSVELTVKERPVTQINIDFEYSAIQTGSTYQLVAQVSPSNATNKTIVWSSSNNDVIEVIQDGTITAKSTGIAVITAKSASTPNILRTLTIMVKDTIEVSSLSLNHTSVTLYKGKYAYLSCYVNPSNATNQDVVWSSSDTDIVTVSQSGTLTAHNAGTATITVTSANGKTQSCTVTVPSVSASSFYLDSNLITDLYGISVGHTQTLGYTCLSSKGFDYDVTDKVVWSSSRPEVASIDANGVLVAHTTGSTIITATLSGITRTVLVVVE